MLPALATVRRPVAVVAIIVLAALLVLALLADPVLLAAGLAWAGIVVAWGWPALLGSSSRFGSSLAIGVTGVLAPVAGVATTDEPYLRLVPVALLIGLAVMFGHQMVRRDGRPRLTESIGITSLGLAVVALGTTWMPLSRSSRASDIALLGFVSIAVASLADLVAGFAKVRPWMLPLAMLLGGAGAVVAAAVAGSPSPAPAALVGFLVRRGLARHPPDAQRAAGRQLGARPAVDRRGIPAGARRRRLRARPGHRRLTARRPARASVSRRGPGRPGATTSSTNAAAPRMTTPGSRSSTVRPRRAAHWPQTVTRAPSSRASRRSASGAACGSDDLLGAARHDHRASRRR